MYKILDAKKNLGHTLADNVLVGNGGFGGVAVCQASGAAQTTFAFSSANSNVFVFGGSAQMSTANSVVVSTPWNVQVVWHISV